MEGQVTSFLSKPALSAVVIVLAMLLATACGTEQPLSKHNSEENPYRDADLRGEIITVSSSTYGYNILMDGRILIHQRHIPALPGTEGFRSEEDAWRVAQFVIAKIRKNIFPPSISLEELDSLGVVY